MIGLLIGGGLGKRLDPKPSSKPMVEVNARPLYTYPMDLLSALGVKSIKVIAGPNSDFADDVLARDGYRDKLHHRPFVTSGLTIPDSIANAAPFGDDVAMIFADEWLPVSAAVAMRHAFDNVGMDVLLASVWSMPNNDVRKTYALLVTRPFRMVGTWSVQNLIEKPTFVPNGLVGTGFAIAKEKWANLAEEVRNKKDWVDIWKLAIDRGANVKTLVLDCNYFNVNTTEDLAALREYVSER